MTKNVNWWGYLHSNGSVQVKPIAWTFVDDIQDARASPFVKEVCSGVYAESREEAIQKVTEYFGV